MADDVPLQKAALHCPPLEEVAKVLEGGLKKNFADVSVTVEECPDLTQKPFMLAAPGLCGQPRVADIGGVPYLIPLPQNKVYQLEQVPRWTEVRSAFMVGAGAAPRHIVGVNAEMITNLCVDISQSEVMVKNNTHICRMNVENQKYILEQLEGSTDCCLLVNLYVCEGKPGKVLSVKAGHRTGPLNYMECLRLTLKDHYGEKTVGLGGTFLVEEGRAKIHVMPEYSTVPLNTDADVDNWLKFFEMEAPLVCLGYLMSHDPGLDLRMEHFHCFSDHGDGGHYHYDTTPEQVKYHGYFNVAEYLYRVDRPAVTHMVGRD